MTVGELEVLANKGAEMPEGLDSADQILYLKLRLLFASFRKRIITPEQGKQEKEEIYKAIEKDRELQRRFEWCDELLKFINTLQDNEDKTCQNIAGALRKLTGL